MYKFIFTISICLVSLFSSMAQTKNFIDQAYLKTSVKLDTLVSPDKIYLSIIIKEEDSKGRISVEKKESKMIKALEELGIDTKGKLTVNNFNSKFRNKILRNKDVYKTKSYSLIVNNGLLMSKVMLSLEAIDIANVYIYNAEYSKKSSLRTELIGKALYKCKAKAKMMCDVLGQKLGSAIYISDEYNSYKNNDYANIRMTSFSTKSVSEQPANLNVRKIHIEVSVNVNFSIL